MYWSPSHDATSYRIDYHVISSGGCGRIRLSGGSTDEYILTDLQNGETYNISILATSGAAFHSPRFTIMVGLGKVIKHAMYIEMFGNTTKHLPYFLD